MRITYGIDIEKETTPYMAIAAETMATFAAVFVPGKYLVETFPILRFLPSWLPGARFKREGKEWTQIVRRLRDTPWNATVAAMVRSAHPSFVVAAHTEQRDGTAPPSIITSMLERTSGLEGQALAEETTIAKDTASAAYAGTAGVVLTMCVYRPVCIWQVVQTRYDYVQSSCARS